MTLFKKFYGHVKVPYTFVITNTKCSLKRGNCRKDAIVFSSKNVWPTYMVGLKLGERIYGIQRLHRYKNHHKDFIDLGLYIFPTPTPSIISNSNKSVSLSN